MGEKFRQHRRRHLISAGVALAAAFSSVLVAPMSSQAAESVSVSNAVARILADTNALRSAGGLAPLVESTAMDAVAQTWSAQMYANGALTHNPNYSTQIPAGWTGAAENIASGYTFTTVVEGWHQSAGHYANIMGNYNAIGIGYFESNGQTYFTQDFGQYSTVPSPAAPPASGAATQTPTPTPTPSPVPAQSIATSTASTAPTPVVSGSKIIDSRTGSTWIPHAVNWPSFEYACQQGWAESADGATSAAAAAMVSWGINAVRIPLNQDCWLGVDGAPAFGTTASYKAALAAWVNILNQAGLVVILDLHWTAPTGFAANGQRAMPDAQSVTFWTQAATYFKSSPSVLFETFNEPYSRGSYTVSWACWKNGGCQVPSSNDQSAIGTSTYTAVGQAQVVAAIRATGATQPILLDGLNYANDLTGWLANKPSDSQLIASWHNYPGQGCDTTTCWNSQIVPVAASVPVIATEFGETDGQSTFITSFMNWADAAGIGYAPWAWWVTDSSDGADANLYSLITDLTNFTPRGPEGTAYQSHLAALLHPGFLRLGTGSPIGWIDSVTTGVGSVTVSGWALDYDSVNPVTVTFTVDGIPTAVTASAAHSGLDAAFPGYGDNHGFTTTFTGISGGDHTLCIVATNLGPSAPNSSLGGCRTITIRTGSPIGWIDSVTTGVGSVTVSGWALDYDSVNPVTVTFTVDGIPTAVTASAAHSGLDAAFPGYGDNHGFTTTFTGISGGDHTLCIVATNLGPSAPNSSLGGCRTITIRTGSPIGWIDSVTTGVGSVTVSGWALDYDSVNPVTVTFTVDGIPTAVTASAAHSGLDAAFPGYGDNHGFTTTFTGISGGDHTLCIVATNLGPSAPNSSLGGCRTITI